MNKKIIIDMTVLAQGVKTGIYRVAHELVKYLTDNESFDVIYTLSRESFFRDMNIDLRAGLDLYVEETKIEAPFVVVEMDPAFVGADFYFSPFFSVPDNWANEKRVQKVVVAYDLIPIINPEYFDDGMINLLTDFYNHIQPDWIVFAISECTKTDLLDYRANLNPENVAVLYLGADTNYNTDIPVEARLAVKKKYHIPLDKPYFLSVATIEIRKNLETAVRAFSEFVNAYPDDDSLLILTGMSGWKLDKLKAEISKWPKSQSRIIFTGFVDEVDLPALYSGAEAFVYLSYYEGFGLPPLEAMSCGVPVISSNNSSLPEVVGNAGIMVSPTDWQGASSALSSLRGNKDYRDELVGKSIERSKLFSWSICGEKFISVLNSKFESSPPFLSIITICFNEKDIKDTCESIVNQTFQSFEWVVVDGGSNSETLNVLNKYKKHIDVFISEKDNGRYDAMNKGISRSSGKYLLFLNGGDSLYYEKTLENIFQFSVPYGKHNILHSVFDCDILYGEVVTKETGLLPYPAWKTGEQSHDVNFFAGSSLPHQATFIKKDLFSKYGSYDLDYQYAGDYEWFMRVILKEGVLSQYLPTIVSIYNFDGVSSQSCEADAPHIIEIQKAFAKYSRMTTTQYPKDNDTSVSENYGANLETSIANDISESFLLKYEKDNNGLQKYADPDYSNALLLKTKDYLSFDEHSILSSFIGHVFEKRSMKDMVYSIDFLKEKNTAAGLLYTYLQRLFSIIYQQTVVIDAVPYIRNAINFRENINSLIACDEKASSTISDNNTLNLKRFISELYEYLLGRAANEEELNTWEEVLLSPDLNLMDFFVMIQSSEEAKAYELSCNKYFYRQTAHTMLQTKKPYKLMQMSLRHTAQVKKYHNNKQGA
jgi:glycosyltransferase involved in cell wall biosynthesis